MKFGFMVPRESDFADTDDPYERIYELCQEAEDLGYDFATFTHHRFSAERPNLSSPLVLMSAIAARTKRLRLVTTIFILPLYHPLEVAESVASLDNISGGRVVLGVGSGYRPYEAAAVGVPFDRRISRMTESIDILQQAWTSGSFSFAGEHFSFDDVDVYPKPTQQPRPPIWIGALEAKPVERAGASPTAGSRRTSRRSRRCEDARTPTGPLPRRPAGHRPSVLSATWWSVTTVMPRVRPGCGATST